MIPVLVFDLETVADTAGLRRIHDIPQDIADADIQAWFAQHRRATSGSDFAPLHLQKVVAIGCALRDDNGLRVWSVGELDDDEPELLRRFFDGIERFKPQLVSWNGGGFDLPVLGYRALRHGVSAARYWEVGDNDREFRYNNYLGRYHTRHIDVMDVLACYQPRASAKLDEMARLCGFPG
jgi:predicted PolB exonuclease-like 3'-5' exonuclease